VGAYISPRRLSYQSTTHRSSGGSAEPRGELQVWRCGNFDASLSQSSARPSASPAPGLKWGASTWIHVSGLPARLSLGRRELSARLSSSAAAYVTTSQLRGLLHLLLAGKACADELEELICERDGRADVLRAGLTSDSSQSAHPTEARTPSDGPRTRNAPGEESKGPGAFAKCALR
jgi:hypothetical protein